MNKKIVSAIHKKRILQFIYSEKERMVEPQTYGISATGKELLRAYELAGKPGQSKMVKLFEVKKISNLKMCRQTFKGALPFHNPKDSAMAEIFISLPKEDGSK